MSTAYLPKIALSDVTGADSVRLLSRQQCGDMQLSLTDLAGFIDQQNGAASFKPQYFVPSAGDTVSLERNGSSNFVLLQPLATIAAMTLVMPATSLLSDGDVFSFTSTQTVTTLTVQLNGAAEIVSGLALTANVPVKLIYLKAQNRYFKHL